MENNFQHRSIYPAQLSIKHEDKFILNYEKSEKILLLLYSVWASYWKLYGTKNKRINQDEEKSMEHGKQEIQHMTGKQLPQDDDKRKIKIEIDQKFLNWDFFWIK